MHSTPMLSLPGSFQASGPPLRAQSTVMQLVRILSPSDRPRLSGYWMPAYAGMTGLGRLEALSLDPLLLEKAVRGAVEP